MKTKLFKRGIRSALSLLLIFAVMMSFAVPSLAADVRISKVELNSSCNVLEIYLTDYPTVADGVDLASKIYLKRGYNGLFNSLPYGSTAELSGSKITVRLTSPLTEAENYVRIQSGAFVGQIQDAAYAVAIDASGPKLATTVASIDSTRRVITLTFDSAITSAIGTNYLEDGTVLVDRTGSGYFSEKVPGNNVSINSSAKTMKITLSTAISGNNTRIKIAAGAVKKVSNGNVNFEDLITDKIDATVIVPEIDQNAKTDLTAEGDQFTITFNTNVKFATTAIENDPSKYIFISRQAGSYYPLDYKDKVTIVGNKVKIQLYYPIEGNNNRVKFLANSIASLSGDVATTELYSPWINMSDLAYNAPVYSSVSYNKSTKQVQIKFSANINAVSYYALISGIQISRNKGEFEALSQYDSVEIINKNTIAITLEQGLTGEYNRFRIEGGTVKGESNNIQMIAQITSYIDLTSEQYAEFEYEISMSDDMCTADIVFDRYIESNLPYDDDLDFLKAEISVMRSGTGNSYNKLSDYDAVTISGRTLRLIFQRPLSNTDIIRINKYALKDSYGTIMNAAITTGPGYSNSQKIFDPDTDVDLSADKRTVTFKFIQKVYNNMASMASLRYMVRVSYDGETFEELSDDCEVKFISDGVLAITFDRQLTNPEAMVKILPGALQDSKGNTINEEIVTNPLGQTTSTIEVLLGGSKKLLGDEQITSDAAGNKTYIMTINATKLASNLATYTGVKTFEVKFPDYAYGGKMKINGSALKQLLDKGFTVTVTCAENSQVLTADDLALSTALSKLGLGSDAAQSVILEATVTRVESPYTSSFNSKASEKSFTILTQPTQMMLTYSYGTKTYSITSFENYSTRRFKIKPSNTQNKNLTIVRIEPSGNVNPVPTKIYSNGTGGYYLEAKVKNNGVFGVITAQRSFTDTPTWAENAVNTLASRMILQNQSAAPFQASKPISRAEVSEIITRALGILTDKSGSSKFLDVATTDWYFSSTSIANEADIIRGYEDATFRPDRSITRQEVMAIMSRVMTYLGSTENQNMTTAQAEQILARFKDDNKVANWAKIDMAKCVAAGVVNGDDKGNLNPNANITRAEMSQLIYNLLTEYSLISGY